MARGIERLRIQGVPVDHVSMARALAFVENAITKAGAPQYILSVNPEKVMVLQHDATLKALFEKAALLIPDGIGVVLAIRWLFKLPASRVPGSELMPHICRLAQKRGFRVFVYGSREAVNREAVKRLNVRFPGIALAGRCNGYIGPSEMSRLVRQINDSGADILFVALGSPKQEEWMANWLPHLRVKICQGIGGTLDTIVGNVRRAPFVFRMVGLEWFYRLAKEPRRWRRQLAIPRFALSVLREGLLQKRRVMKFGTSINK